MKHWGMGVKFQIGSIKITQEKSTTVLRDLEDLGKELDGSGEKEHFRQLEERAWKP